MPSPIQFNIIIDKIIKEVKTENGYRMKETEIEIICYDKDDARLIAKSENGLHRLLMTMARVYQSCNMKIATQKNKIPNGKQRIDSSKSAPLITLEARYQVAWSQTRYNNNP